MFDFFQNFEWLVAISTGEAADAFLRTQRDPWDTQSDMALALIGAIVSQFLLSKLHDRQLKDHIS